MASNSSPDAWKRLCQAWLCEARAKLQQDALRVEDLDQLAQILEPAGGSDLHRDQRRQRLLYLHASDPSITAQVIGMALHEPVAGGAEAIGQRDQWPYPTVHEAIQDGWQVINIPNQLARFDDRDLDILGYEFVLQKWSDGYDDGESPPG